MWAKWQNKVFFNSILLKRELLPRTTVPLKLIPFFCYLSILASSLISAEHKLPRTTVSLKLIPFPYVISPS